MERGLWGRERYIVEIILVPSHMLLVSKQSRSQNLRYPCPAEREQLDKGNESSGNEIGFKMLSPPFRRPSNLKKQRLWGQEWVKTVNKSVLSIC